MKSQKSWHARTHTRWTRTHKNLSLMQSLVIATSFGWCRSSWSQLLVEPNYTRVNISVSSRPYICSFCTSSKMSYDMLNNAEFRADEEKKWTWFSYWSDTNTPCLAMFYLCQNKHWIKTQCPRTHRVSLFTDKTWLPGMAKAQAATVGGCSW